MGVFTLRLLALTILLKIQHTQAVNFTVQRWNPIQITLNATGKYSTPYIDVDDLNGIFISLTQ
jgi:hypothetical protein